MSAPGMGANDRPEPSRGEMAMFVLGGEMAVDISAMCM